MSMPSNWPDDLRHALSDTHGTLISQDRLGGMSGAEVYRLTFADHTAILKITPRPTEPHFYATLAPILRAHAINVPNLEFSTTHDARHWLVIEHIPHPLPRDRWFADAEVLAMLSRLHVLNITISDGYQPAWTEAMTENALAAIGAHTSSQLAARLHQIRAAYQYLFEPECIISADPNPANWGLRANGELVLFDWERITLGNPAIDIAISVPQLGSAEQFSTIAAAYQQLTAAPHNPNFASDLAAAKLWTLIEFAHEHHIGAIQQEAAVKWIGSNLEAWLSSLKL